MDTALESCSVVYEAKKFDFSCINYPHLLYCWAHGASMLQTFTSWMANFLYSLPLTWMGIKSYYCAALLRWLCWNWNSDKWRGSWKTHYEPIEVEGKGFARRSLCKVFNQLGGKEEGHPIHKQSHRGSHCGFELRELNCGHMLLGVRSGPDQPQLCRLGEGVWFWQTQNTRWPQVTSLTMCPSPSRQCILHRLSKYYWNERIKFLQWKFVGVVTLKQMSYWFTDVFLTM